MCEGEAQLCVTRETVVCEGEEQLCVREKNSCV